VENENQLQGGTKNKKPTQKKLRVGVVVGGEGSAWNPRDRAARTGLGSSPYGGKRSRWGGGMYDQETHHGVEEKGKKGGLWQLYSDTW